MFKFDRSLMQRLANNGFPMSQINVQRHMRPTISHMEPPRPDTSATRDGESGWREGHSPSSSIGSSLPQTNLPSLSVRSLSSLVHPVMSPDIDHDEVRRAAMHNAAERAMIRRQREWEEREKAKERARKKAKELATKIEVQEFLY